MILKFLLFMKRLYLISKFMFYWFLCWKIIDSVERVLVFLNKESQLGFDIFWIRSMNYFSKGLIELTINCSVIWIHSVNDQFYERIFTFWFTNKKFFQLPNRNEHETRTKQVNTPSYVKAHTTEYNSEKKILSNKPHN